jgi:hypothetical protein
MAERGHRADRRTQRHPDRSTKDIIALDSSVFTDLTAVQHASQQAGTNTTVISDNVGDNITLLGVSLSQVHFDASNFLLA